MTFIAGDGVYSVSEDGIIKLVDLKSNTTRNLVQQADVKDVGYPTLLSFSPPCLTISIGARFPNIPVGLETIR